MISLVQEQSIRDQIAALKAQLPRDPHEPSEPLHAVVSKVFLDGATHTRSVDLANDWKRIGGSIRDAVRQGGEVTLRPLYPGEAQQDTRDYPSTRRIRELEDGIREALKPLYEGGHIWAKPLEDALLGTTGKQAPA